MPNDTGSTLLELMAVVMIVAIMAVFAMPRLQTQIAVREIETIGRRFIMHANFARNQALHLGESVRIAPREFNQWNLGWIVSSGCLGKLAKSDCKSKNWFSQAALFPIYFKTQGFNDPHSNRLGILFNPAGAAKTGQGGFVANRLVLGHQKHPALERHLILSSGGRWRICDPQVDVKSCK